MNCPECNAKIEDDPLLDDGEVIVCHGCDEYLEVVYLEGGGVVLESDTEGTAEAILEDEAGDDTVD